MRRVMIGTPSYDGRVTIEYVSSLVKSMKDIQDVELLPCFLTGLVDLTRNNMVRVAIQGEVDDLVFIDDDIGFTPDGLRSLLSHDLPVVAGTYRYKTDDEKYMVRLDEDVLMHKPPYLYRVDGVPGGFLRLRRDAMLKLWDAAKPYDMEGEQREIFPRYVDDNRAWGEDYAFCKLWQSIGGEVWIDSSIKLDHIGKKVYTGRFTEWIMENTRR